MESKGYTAAYPGEGPARGSAEGHCIRSPQPQEREMGVQPQMVRKLPHSSGRLVGLPIFSHTCDWPRVFIFSRSCLFLAACAYF